MTHVLESRDLYILRAAAIASADPVVRAALCTLLLETECQVLEALEASCWAEDLSDDEAVQREQLRESLWNYVPDHLRSESGGTLQAG